MKLHLHDWSEWSVPVEDYSGYKRQWRACNICNKVSHRKLYWDGQSNIGIVLKALEDVFRRNKGHTGH